MTAQERTRLRKLQDAFLALPIIRQFATENGDQVPITRPDGPTVDDLKRYLYPDDAGLFHRFTTQ